MGVAPLLYAVDLRWTAAKLSVACKSYFPQRSGQRIYFSRLRKPANITPTEIGNGVALAWACNASEHPINGTLRTEEYQSSPLVQMPSGFYQWDVGGKPMVLLEFPLSSVLQDADPEPADVWKRDGRVCAFWQAPNIERKIAFKVGADASLDRNIEYWQKRLDSHTKRHGPHPVFLVLALIALIIAASIVLGIVFNQATAAAWIGAGAAVAGLIGSLIAPQLKSRRRKPFKSHPLPSEQEPVIASDS